MSFVSTPIRKKLEDVHEEVNDVLQKHTRQLYPFKRRFLITSANQIEIDGPQDVVVRSVHIGYLQQQRCDETLRGEMTRTVDVIYLPRIENYVE